MKKELKFEGIVFNKQGILSANNIELENVKFSRWFQSDISFRFKKQFADQIPFNTGDKVEVIVRKVE